jgi:hypothetical protein
MKSCHYNYEIELFAVTGGVLVLDGWLDSETSIASVRLIVAGRDRQRMRLREDPDLSGLDQAEIEISAGNGDRLVWQIGDLFRPAGWMPSVVEARGFGTYDAAGLAAALGDDFAALDDAADLFVHPRAEGWAATSHRYGFEIPARPGTDREEARSAATAAARAAAAALAADLDEGVPLLVHAQRETDTEDAIDWLFASLRARNPQAVLLWVDPHRDDALVQPQAGLLIGGARIDPEALIERARDALIAPR